MLPPGRTDFTLSGDILFSPMRIIFSRICSFILPDSWQGGSLWGALLEIRNFVMHHFWKCYGNRPVFIIDTNLNQKPNGVKCEWQQQLKVI